MADQIQYKFTFEDAIGQRVPAGCAYSSLHRVCDEYWGIGSGGDIDGVLCLRRPGYCQHHNQ